MKHRSLDGWRGEKKKKEKNNNKKKKRNVQGGQLNAD